jgi:UrcA family protein
MNTKTLAIAAIAAAGLSAAAAQANDLPPSMPASMKVRIADLNLSRGPDVMRLYYRLYEAAELVCGGGPLAFYAVATPPAYNTCRDTTLDAALAQFQEPLVVSTRTNLKLMHKLPPG